MGTICAAPVRRNDLTHYVYMWKYTVSITRMSQEGSQISRNSTIFSTTYSSESKDTNEAPHCWPFVRGILRKLAPAKGQ